jgi:hypothetical protein
VLKALPDGARKAVLALAGRAEVGDPLAPAPANTDDAD